MVTTRSKTTTGADTKHSHQDKPQTTTHKTKPVSKKNPAAKHKSKKVRALEKGSKRDVEETQYSSESETKEQPPRKKVRPASPAEAAAKKDHPLQHTFQNGIIERGHIYFFYRPKVQLEEAHSIYDVQRFHILLVPRPPGFSIQTDEDMNQDDEGGRMKVLGPGADAVPAPEETNVIRKPFRLIAVGKKSLPDPEAGGGGKGGGRKQLFWATITTVGDDLHKLEEGLGEKSYETKTRGTRHQGPARLAGRGAYAIVNTEGRTPSSRETHLGYHLSHPSPDDFGEVQEALGIQHASSFVVQVKNPLAPNTGGARVGLSDSARAEFPDSVMNEVFGEGSGEGHRGREKYGLRFASVERKEMLDYEGAELLFIAAHSGEEGLEASLGEGRGEALRKAEEGESMESVDQVLEELAMDAKHIPADPLSGEWI